MSEPDCSQQALREVAETGELQTALEENERLRSRLAEAEFDLKNAAQALRIAVGRQTKAEARLDWIEANLIEGKWDGTIGRPKSWVMVGPHRHTLQKMRGDSLREAIDAAMEQSHE